MTERQSRADGARIEVLFVSLRLDVGGTEKHLARTLPELRGHGIDPSLFVMARGGALESTLTAAGVPLFGPPPGAGRARAAVHLLRHLLARRPDVIHFFLTEPYLIGSIAAIIAGVRPRIMSRRSLARYQGRHPLLARFERWLHRRTDVLLGNSAAVVAELVRETGTPDKVGLIYNGVDLPPPSGAEARTQARRSLGLPPDGLVMTIVANLIAYKGYDDLLQALALLGDTLPPDWRLLAVGRDGGIGAQLRDQAAALRLSDHVLWAGEQDNVAPFLQAADVALLCSHEEGFSNSLLEALAQGLPVIATAVGGNLDAIRPDETGLLVPAKSPAALAHAIAALAADPALRARLGAAARLDVGARYSIAACVGRYAGVYRSVGKAAVGSVQRVIDSSDGERA